MQNDNKEFPQGIFFKIPNNNAPDFIKGTIKMKLDEAVNYLQNKMRSGEQWITLDLKVSQGGKGYAQVNDWKPDNQQQAPQGTQNAPNGFNQHNMNTNTNQQQRTPNNQNNNNAQNADFSADDFANGGFGGNSFQNQNDPF